MATYWWHAYKNASVVAQGAIVARGKITIGGSTTQGSTSVDPNGNPNESRYVRVFADATCYHEWGANPTADSTSEPLGSENPEYKWMLAGDIIAVLTR